jgi:S1-C subfamily serine protease/regulator of sirC expression with transglutaminase-like and TPR domain
MWRSNFNAEAERGRGTIPIAQSCTLPYRRFAIGQPSELSNAPRSSAWRVANPRYSRLKIRATSQRQTHNRLLAVVALALISIHPLDGAQKPVSTKQTPAKTRPAAPAETPSIEALTAAAMKSVVVIKHFGRDGKEDGVGAGFVISEDGLIATSLHVVGEARPISVQFADGKRQEVTEVFASDRNFDLAILRVTAGKLPALPLGDSDALKQGASVIALGNPLGLEHSVVRGVVSARREMDGVEMIQVAIPIEPGNSGGPLLDLKGRVHGILTLKSAMTRNLGFAMPGNLLKALLDKPNPVPMSRWLTIGALPPRDWQPLFGARWSQKAGRIQVEGEGKGFGGRSLCLSQKPAPARPYEVAVSVRLNDEAGAAGLVFASDGGDRHYGFYPSGGQLRLTRFEGPNVYSWSILKQVPTEHYRQGDWNHLRVRVEPEKILCYVNGELVAESDDTALAPGQVGLAKFRDTRAEFRGFETGTNLLRDSSIGARTARPRESAERADEPSALQRRARELEHEAARLRRQAVALHRQSVLAELSKTLEGPEETIDLLGAALLVARLDNAELEIEPYRQQVADMAREISSRLPAKAGDAAKLTALREYLFAENGFHGSRSDYYHRANSYLDRVLDDREGLPITLSILFMELARRIGLDGVGGLPLPGHFMVGFKPKEGPEQIIDVFNGGKVLSRSEAQDRIVEATGEGFRDADYRRATKREIIVRMLRNLLGIAQRGEPGSEALRYLDAIVALSPDSVPDRLLRAQLRLQTGDTAGAKADFKWLLDQKPPGVDLERIAEFYRTL